MQDQQSRRAADARLAIYAGRGTRYFAMLGVLITLSFVCAVLATAVIATSEPGTLALAIDFRAFWAAAQLALAGDPLAAFDHARLAELHGVDPNNLMPWLYPPGYLLLITPLGALSFASAMIVSTLLSLLAVALAMRSFVAGNTPLWIAMIFSPAYLPALMIGQNSLLWMAALLAVLAALRSQSWVVAGIFIGCLTLKPQLGIMIPFALLAAGSWRTILSAIVTTVLVAVLPTLIYSIDYWPLLLQGVTEQGKVMMEHIAGLDLMVGLLALLTSLGVDPKLALVVQWVVTAASALAVVVLWRSDCISFDVKAAGLLSAIMLSSVYLWYYEGALMPAIALFLLRAGILHQRPLDLAFFGLLWLGGGILAMNTLLDVVDNTRIGAVIFTPLLLACLGLCLHALFTARPAPATST